jgi:hypothetical protein
VTPARGCTGVAHQDVHRQVCHEPAACGQLPACPGHKRGSIHLSEWCLLLCRRLSARQNADPGCGRAVAAPCQPTIDHMSLLYTCSLLLLLQTQLGSSAIWTCSFNELKVVICLVLCSLSLNNLRLCTLNPALRQMSSAASPLFWHGSGRRCTLPARMLACLCERDVTGGFLLRMHSGGRKVTLV